MLETKTNHKIATIFFVASEPNLLKIRLKQSVIERKARIGPFAAKRHERLLAAHRRSAKHHSQVPSTFKKNVFECFFFFESD